MRILIAEDDAHLRNGLAKLLEREGHTCITAKDGAAALATFRAQAPDFCLLDVVMPSLDGIELCRAIRDEDADVPILLLTARGQEIDRVLGLESGADDYVPKPFSTRELIARIRAIARRSNRQSGTQRRFRLGDLEIDREALRAFRGVRMIDLTRREVALLAVLHARTGLAVSRDELLNVCWGRDHLPSSRALDQYVSVLRRKIERDPSNPRLIRTVHGVGYRYDG
ncbi:response regulator transcription factor [Billgrantia azerbaijanica]|nr:response regulator transcription factor [Halomonas azerbaijanica]